MKRTKQRNLRWLAPVFVLAALAGILSNRLEAADVELFGPGLPVISFHGFASQGFLASSSYNYLGDSRDGSFEFTEAGINASINPFPRTRITAQGFLYDVGEAGKYDAVLDYALAEYTFSDYFGLRAGRLRRPQGIYNDIQDVDLARTFVLLPQGIYDARFRDFYVSMDGGEIFGTLPLGKAGSLSYNAYAGVFRASLDGGVALQFKNSLPSFIHLDRIDPAAIFGGQMWWNTPVTGLRLGASLVYVPDFVVGTIIQTPGGPFGSDQSLAVFVQQYSAEYVWKAWTFQTEAMLRAVTPASPGTGTVLSWYASGAYRFNKRFQVGSYYTEYYGDIRNLTGAGTATPSDAYQRDAAVAFRVDVTDRWIFKVEGHYLRGTALLQDNMGNPNRRDNGWFMIALKSTISF